MLPDDHPAEVPCRACARPVPAGKTKRGKCSTCYAAERRAGQDGEHVPGTAADHPNWRGDGAGYGAAHLRVSNLYGAAALYHCAWCRRPAGEWSLLPGAGRKVDPDHGCAYSTDPADYVPMCKPCHSRLDRAVRGWADTQAVGLAGALPGVAWDDYPAVLPEVPVIRDRLPATVQAVAAPVSDPLPLLMPEVVA